MMPKNIEKNMYLRRRQGKITLLWCPKNTDNLWFLFKSPYCDARKYWKKHVLKTSPVQNHFTMMPKKNNLLFFLKVTLLWCPRILKKTCNLRHRLGKIILLWYPKNTDNLKSHYYDAGKYWKNYVFKPWPSQNHATMIPNKCIFVDILVEITLFWCPKILMPENCEKQTCTFKTRSNALMFSWY